MKERKEIVHFIEEINQIALYNTKSHEKKYVIMKIILLKWLLDHKLLDRNDIKESSLKEEFTLQNMLYLIGGQKIHLMKESHHGFTQGAWEKIHSLLIKQDIFSTLPSTIFGEIYEYLNEMDARKKGGMYYTPFFIIDFMLDKPIKRLNLHSRIIDPACGSGFFLSQAYDHLFHYYRENPHLLGNKKEIIHDLILKQLYGIEKDTMAATITKLVLILKQPYHINPNINIFNHDSLLENNPNIKENTFDLVIGNPPYIGHKKIDKDYSLLLKEKYSQVYHDKGDISYCFFQKGINLLKEGGSMVYITSRYFLEALYGKNLRGYILDHSKIAQMIDFYGQRVFKGIGIDPIIITLIKDSRNKRKDHEIDIIRLKNRKGNIPGQEILDIIKDRKESSYMNCFSIPQNSLQKEGWRLLNTPGINIIDKIEKGCVFRLGDICDSKQGIITGRDKAFIITKQEAQEKKLHHQFLKPWIKGKNISPFCIEKNTHLLIYSNDIEDINHWKDEKNHLMPYKEGLENRRECIRGYRKWYELQWGREKVFFDSPKIIFPYKASHNRFVLDTQGHYYSADVYGMKLKEQYKSKISLEVLTLLLNSGIYEFYFKSFGKKLGENLYEYYPNTLMELSIPSFNKEEEKNLKSYYHKIMYCVQEGKQEEIQTIHGEVQEYLLKYFQLSQRDEEYMTSLLKSETESKDKDDIIWKI